MGTSILIDNYRKVCPTLVHSVHTRLDEKVYPKQTVNSSLLDRLIVPRDSQFKVHQDAFCPAVNRVHSGFCLGHPQKKGLSPISKNKIKDVKGVSCVNPCVSVPHVHSVPSVVPTLAVGGRLQKFWQKWFNLGANPRVVSILKEGHTLSFKMRPPLTRSSVVLSGYANPVKNWHLKEVLLALTTGCS